jgi:hypothetical protein
MVVIHTLGNQAQDSHLTLGQLLDLRGLRRWRHVQLAQFIE